MSYEASQQCSESRAQEHKELISQLRGIKITLIVALIVLIAALTPWWLIGMQLLLAEMGMVED